VPHDICRLTLTKASAYTGAVDAALRALADPSRRTILRLVRNRELPAGEIARHFPYSRPAVSQHLRVLKDAGLVTERRDGTRRIYELAPDGLAELRGYFDRFWSEALANFKAAAESTKGDEP
jgi:DNA-binding transcriptional ArsR family regulator